MPHNANKWLHAGTRQHTRASKGINIPDEINKQLSNARSTLMNIRVESTHGKSEMSAL